MSASPAAMIRCVDLTKAYGPHLAVKGITFEVARGEVLGFLGPNGAGKSTTMKILTCYLTPTTGRAEIAGHDVYGDSLEVRRRIGYLPEDTPLYKDMTVLEYLEYVCELRRIPAQDRRPRIKTVGETTGIMGVLGRKVGELSRGYRQRVGLTQALVHDPDVLVLDEPTSGLDPNQIVEIRELIRSVGKSKTVILSTHILPEVQATCNRVVIISDGRLVADGRPDELVAREKSNRFRVLFAASGAPEGTTLEDKLKAIDGVGEVTRTPGAEPDTIQLVVTTDADRDIRRELFQVAADNRWPLLELERREASLEEVFRRLTRVEADAKVAPAVEAA